MTSKYTRREFLRRSSALSILGTGTPFALNLAALSSAAAAPASDYRALVCLFFAGGSDTHNVVLATDTTSWTAYQTARNTGADPIALLAAGTPPNAGAAINTPARLGGVLPITPLTAQSGRSFALHPALPWLTSQFAAGRAAVVSNVGPLIVPTTKAQYRARSVPLPPKLFSHNDQQSLWQSYSPEGARVGWGGRLGDLLVAAGNNAANPLFTAISTSGSAVWLSGQNVLQYQVGSSGPTAIGGMTGTLFGSGTASATFRSLITGTSSQLFESEHAKVVSRSIDAQSRLATTMLPAGASGVPNPPQYTNPATGTLATNGLAGQLQTVARMIGAQAALGVQRQVFFVQLGGFDTHDFQNREQPRLMAQIDAALQYFYGVLASLGGRDYTGSVTTFTASDFGRTFTTNGDGTDHGWGSHQFVVGGGVKGGDLYGRFPITGLNHDDEVGSGSLLPVLSVDQYGATLGKWFGVSDADLLTVFPSLGNFTQRDVGFMV